MNILYVLAPVALLLAGAAAAAFVWSVRSGQYEDVETPAMRMLFDRDPDESVPVSEEEFGKRRRTQQRDDSEKHDQNPGKP